MDYQPNKFFIKREEGSVHGAGPKLMFMAMPPRVLSEADALTLAADLTKHAGGPMELWPYLEAAYGGPANLRDNMDAAKDAKEEKEEQLKRNAEAQSAAKAQAAEMHEANLRAALDAEQTAADDSKADEGEDKDK